MRPKNPKKFELYCIVNAINNKEYIGITTVGVRKRFCDHKSKANSGINRPLYRAIRKYGIDNFSISVIGEASSWEALCALEIKTIEERRTLSKFGKGYNITHGGEGSIGVSPSKITREKLSKARDNWSAERVRDYKRRHSKSARVAYNNLTSKVKKDRATKISKGRVAHFANIPEEEKNKWKDKIRTTLRNKSNNNSKKCLVKGKEYISLSEAGRYLSISYDTVRRRILSNKWPDYNWYKDE